MINAILFNILKVVLYPLWLIFKKQAMTQLNSVIDQLQEKYLNNTNALKENLLNAEYLGDKNLVSNQQVREIVKESQNNFNMGLGLDANGKPNANMGINIKF